MNLRECTLRANGQLMRLSQSVASAQTFSGLCRSFGSKRTYALTNVFVVFVVGERRSHNHKTAHETNPILKNTSQLGKASKRASKLSVGSSVAAGANPVHFAIRAACKRQLTHTH